MPVYNGGEYLGSAIESILTQTLTDFEFIIIDDGSTDDSWEILNAYARSDARIYLMKNEKNEGIVFTLNRGLSVAQGTYIARIDANDISTRRRLETQVDYLNSHPDIGVLGMNISYIDRSGNLLYQGRRKDPAPMSSTFIHWSLLWRCAIYHVTIMLRRSLLEVTGYHYDENYRHVEDYQLWTRLMHHTTIGHLHEVGTLVRLLSTGISSEYSSEQTELTVKIRSREISRFLGAVPSESALDTLAKAFSYNSLPGGDFEGASNLLLMMFRRFCETAPDPRVRAEVLDDVVKRQVQLAYRAAISGQFLVSLRLFVVVRRFSVRGMFSRYTFAHIARAIIVTSTHHPVW